MQEEYTPSIIKNDAVRILFLILLGILRLNSQEIPPFEIINTQSGLSNNIVYDVHKDSQGYIWIATDKGLNRFDGYTFEVFHHSTQDTTSISSNIVRSIEEDGEGRLWIGTFNGLDLFHPKTKTFTHYTNLPKLFQDRLDMQSMKFDGDGKLWLDHQRTMGWFDLRTSRFSFSDAPIKAYAWDIGPKNSAWLITKKGKLMEYDAEAKNWRTVTKKTAIDNPTVHYGQYSHKIWIDPGFASHQENEEIRVLPWLPDDSAPTVVLEVKNGELWLGNEQGLYIYDPKSKLLTPVNFGKETSTLTQAIKSIYQDDTGAIWVGTLSGVFHFDPYQKEFGNLKISPNKGDVIMGLGTYKDLVLVNRLGEGLYSYSHKTDSFKRLSLELEGSENVNFIWDIKEVGSSSYPIWMASNAGLLGYNPEKGILKEIPLAPIDSEELKVSFSILPTENSNVWVASASQIHLLNTQGEILKSVSFKKEIDEAIIQDIAIIEEFLFIATEGQGMYVYNTKTEVAGLLSDYAPNSSWIQNTPIWDLYVQDNKLWMGTTDGLFSLAVSNWQFEKIELSVQVQNQVIFSITEDAQKRLWIGTGSGLALYDSKNGESTYYTNNDGIENVEFNRKSVLQINDELWFGGVQGITRFNPLKIKQNFKVAPVYLTSVEVITPDSLFTPPISEERHIKLPWYHNSLEFSYVALNYTNPAQNQYKYQLKGYDAHWRSDLGNRQARYVQVPPGSYDFYLQASNNDGLWNPDPVHISLEITPPFWETYWFRGLILLLVVLVLWLAYRYRVKKLLEVERIKLRIAGDLHDEIGSGLSGIALTGDLVQRQLNKGNTQPELVSRITKNARTLASLLDAIVWLIDPHKQSVEDLVSKSRAVAQELLPETRLHIKEALGEQKPKRDFNPEQKRNLFLFIKESIHNTAKHAEAEEVVISFTVAQNQFIYQIKDNGKGFDLLNKKQGHGLSSMKKRTVDLKAEFEIDTKIGKGTSIRLCIKLP